MMHSGVRIGELHFANVDMPPDPADHVKFDLETGIQILPVGKGYIMAQSIHPCQN